MNLKLFSLAICLLSFNVSLAMDDAAKKNVEHAMYAILSKSFKVKKSFGKAKLETIND